MKIALCQIGHVRTWQEVKNNQMEKIIQPLDCDIFIDTSTQNSNPLYNKKGKIRHSWLEDAENIEKILIESFGERLKHKNILEEVVDPGFHRYVQWQRLSRCLNDIQNFENENQFKYDIIIKSRFDLSFDRSIKDDIGTVVENMIYGSRHYDSSLKLHDQFFLGKREEMMKFIDFPSVFKKDNNSEKQVVAFIASHKMGIKFIDFSFSMQR